MPKEIVALRDEQAGEPAAMHSILNAEDWIATLPDEVQIAMREPMRAMPFAAGAAVASAGEPATAMFQVESGYLRLTGLQEDGRQVLVTIYGPGACFAETALVARRPMNHSTSALTPARVRRLPATAFWELYHRHPAIPDALCRKFANTISRQLAGRESRVADRLGRRIARMFAGLAERCGERLPDGGVKIGLPITQTDIAEFFDVTRQSIQREMTALKRRGLVAKVEGIWRVYDPERLRAI